MIKQGKMDKIISFSDVYSEYLPQKFASLVSQARKNKKMNQRQLSEALSVSQGWVSRIESGTTRSIRNVDLLIRLWDILDLPDPEEIPNDDLPKEILNLIKVLVRFGDTMPRSAIDTLVGVADLVMRYGASPHIVIPRIAEDTRQKYVPNEYSWQLRPMANYIYSNLHDKFSFERLTIQRVLKITINGKTEEIPETYTSGTTTFLIHYQNAIEEVFGKAALESGGVFSTDDLKEGINNSVRRNEDTQHENAIIIPVIRNRLQKERGANFTGEVKVFLYRKEPFDYNDYVSAKSVVGQFFIDVDQRAETQKNL